MTRHAYHGHSIGVLPLSTEDVPAERRPDWLATIPAPETYRCPAPEGSILDWSLERLDAAIVRLTDRGHGVAALVLDTVLSSEGVTTVPEGFLPAAVERVRAAGGVFIADEVQAGYGRCGTHFCGFERLGATPDLATFGKPMGNGHPLSAVASRPALIERFVRENHYFNTFGGNPVSAAAGLAVLDVIEEAGLMAHAETVGRHLRAKLRHLAGRFSCIGDVRGSGLFIGVDLVEDRATRTPATTLAHRVMNRLRDDGVLIGRTGPGNNVLKLRPPLVIDDDQVDLLLGCLEAALETEASG